MALTQDQVNWWFEQNPNATADDVAAAVKGAGGLEANAGLADMIASRYNIDANQVTDYYNKYTAPTGGLPTSQVVDTDGGSTTTTQTGDVTGSTGDTGALTQAATGSTGSTTGVTDLTTGTTDLTTGLDTTSGLSALNNTANTGATTSTTGATTNVTGTTGALTQATQANEVYIGDNRWLNTTTGQITTDWNRAAPAKTIVKEEDRNGMHFRYYSDGSMDSSVQSTDSFLDFVGDVAPNLALQIGMVMAGGPAGAELSSTLGSTISSQLGLNLSAKAAQALGAGLIRGTLTSAAGGDFVTGAITGAANTGANIPIGDTGLTLGNIGTGVKLLNATDAASIFSALASDPTLSKQTSGFLGTEATNALNTGLKINNVVSKLENGQNGAALTILGELMNSSDTKVAGAALSAWQAIENGGSSAQIANALLNLSNSAGSSSKSTTSTTGSTVVSDSTPLTEDEIADLTPDQLRAYQEGGVSGLRDYNRAIKNLTSLTTSGYTGDSLGGNDTLSTTGGNTNLTRGLTGGLTTATTEDEFDNLMITSLRSQGLNNAQISAYLDNLNSASSGLNDVGLLAFRQAKVSGATDAEALAAANLATGKTTAETNTGTEVELVVTDTDFETNIYSFYDTQSEFETGKELVVTSGRETGQETETETLEKIIITAISETETQSEIESLPVITVTAFSEKETEIETESVPVITVTSFSEKETETETETLPVITVTAFSETETQTETESIPVVTVTAFSETETETESETETETETESIPVITVTAFSETETQTETETESQTITEIIVTTSSETQTETETETITTIVTTPVVTKPPTTSSSFTAGTPAVGGRGKPHEFMKEQLLKTYMTKDSFKDPLAQFNKARQELAKDEMMQQGVDPRLAAILAARMNGEEPPPAPAYNYGEEPQSIDDILGLKVEGERQYAQGGYVQPLMAQGGMALPLLAAKGGLPTMHKGREDFRDGKHVAGEGDGQSDDIPAMLADGEFVFPADVVSALGNGSTKAGTDKLYEMMHSIRDRARSKGPKDLPPPALKSPLDYLKKR